ncbi:unnamed protein product [Allacma fusca]|uniref:Uncharacterized protein n=1 Tax=Allacma fusca TaxID=39272 RepID=A0A8J2NNV3_9HEXA|nr:unnamed protein product [Allacma fusca]
MLEYMIPFYRNYYSLSKEVFLTDNKYWICKIEIIGPGLLYLPKEIGNSPHLQKCIGNIFLRHTPTTYELRTRNEIPLVIN